MKSSAELKNILNQINHRSYPAYKETAGCYQFEGYVLSIDHVQGDPFAAPSRVSVLVKGANAGFIPEYYQAKHRRIALQDFLIREFAKQTESFRFQAKGSGKSGLMSVSRCGQEILERSACQIDLKSGNIVVRMEIGFPANGRTIQSGELIKILFDFLPVCIKKSLYFCSLDAKKVQKTIELAEDQYYIRKELGRRGMIAFVADGAVLPRESGVSSKPMKNAVPFQSPASLSIKLELPYYGQITGMGIPKGITLIVGGGYHGKSTLLKALELGVYNHIAGDGREYVMTDSTAVKIRAEDGRSIKNVDISMFINDLPNKKNTQVFCTQDASGSTSQAANVIEGMEAHAGVLLIDEDTSATNFMIRDELMQRVVHRDAEPITPFIDRMEELYSEYGISTILVAGSCGSYFHKADYILQMEQYLPKDITEFAKKAALDFPIPSEPAPRCKLPSYDRKLIFRLSGKSDREARGNSRAGNERIKIKGMGKEGFSINHEMVDLRYVEQLVDAEQVTALAFLLKYVSLHFPSGTKNVQEMVEELQSLLEQKGFAGICEGMSVNLAMPRAQEIFACLNRWRG